MTSFNIFFEKIFLICISVLLIFICCIPATASEGTVETNIQVAIYLLNLGQVSITTGSFEADFYLSFYHPDNLLPDNFEFMNGRAAYKDLGFNTSNEKFYRIWGKFLFDVDLRKFPFDNQTLTITLEDKLSGLPDLNYTALTKECGIDSRINLTGWVMKDWTAEVNTHYYDVYDEEYSVFTFKFNLGRIHLNSFIKTILPVSFIILLVFFSFFINPDQVKVRMGTAGSSLVASVMFHVSISNQIPPVSYLTFADKFMVTTYCFLFINFIINILVLDLISRKSEILLKQVFKWSKIIVTILVPIVYYLLFHYNL